MFKEDFQIQMKAPLDLKTTTETCSKPGLKPRQHSCVKFSSRMWLIKRKGHFSIPLNYMLPMKNKVLKAQKNNVGIVIILKSRHTPKGIVDIFTCAQAGGCGGGSCTLIRVAPRASVSRINAPTLQNGCRDTFD